MNGLWDEGVEYVFQDIVLPNGFRLGAGVLFPKTFPTLPLLESPARVRWALRFASGPTREIRSENGSKVEGFAHEYMPASAEREVSSEEEARDTAIAWVMGLELRGRIRRQAR